MGRKVFQDFAHVLCQTFIESPSNRDLVNLAILGSGQLEMHVLERLATHNGFPIEPLPFSEQFQAWVAKRMKEAEIPHSLLVAARLTVDYEVELSRKEGLGWLCAQYSFRCASVIEAPDKSYTATMSAAKEWGLLCV